MEDRNDIEKLSEIHRDSNKNNKLFYFFMTLAFLFYSRQTINWKLTSIFFAAMFLFDLTTTAINNYIDSKDYPEMLPLKRNMALAILLIMFFTSTALGLYLAYCTDVVVLLLGILCFLCGVCYTYGPIQISRQPLGELASGIFQGVFVPFLLLYINMPKGTFLRLSLSFQEISLNLQVLPLLTLLLLCVVPTCVTANIMLANNTCDVEKDIKVKRFTLPYYLGTKNSLTLFATLYLLCYIAPCVMVLFGMLHPICLLMLLTFPVVWKNVRIFCKEQKKSTTFIVAIQNYKILMGSYTLVIFFGGLMERFFI